MVSENGMPTPAEAIQFVRAIVEISQGTFEAHQKAQLCLSVLEKLAEQNE